MNTIVQTFKDHLINEVELSEVTVKNYISDLSRFVTWYESSYAKEFVLSDFNIDVLNEFAGIEDVSPRSLERYISTLRRFSTFLFEKDLIAANPFAKFRLGILESKKDPWHLSEFKSYLYMDGASKITSKNYLLDLYAFTSWIEAKEGFDTNISNYIEVINTALINEYRQRLITELGLSESSINRKLSSIRKYLRFADQKLFTKLQIPQAAQIENPVNTLLLEDFRSTIPSLDSNLPVLNLSGFPPLRLIQKLIYPYLALEDLIARKIAGQLVVNRLYKKAENHGNTEAPWHGKLLHHLKNTRPEWYKRYHNNPVVHHIHYGVLMVYAVVVGFMLYNQLFINPSLNKALAQTAAPRVLSFEGKLTDSAGKAIINPTDVRFGLYSSPLSSGSALLWEDVRNIDPDPQGSFRVLLGTNENSIPSGLFSDNNLLYLGITVARTNELSPRQRIAAIPFAENTDRLQGMLPITDASSQNSNVILALDSSGNLSIGGAGSHTFTASGGEFKISGQPLTLSTNTGTNADVSIIPDGLGRIDLEAAILNNGESGQIAPGGIEIHDKTAVLATESAVAAFIINNDAIGGDIFTASSSSTTRFVIQNNGDVLLQQGASIDTLTSGLINIGTSNATGVKIGNIGRDIILPAFTGQNGVLYASFTTGELEQATTPNANLCLISGLQNPSWGSCTASNIWAQNSGVIFPVSSTSDFLIGGSSTSSAKFAVLNVNGPQTQVNINSQGDGVVLRVKDSDGTCDLDPGSGSDWSCSSDEKLKTNIQDSRDALSDIMKITIRDFNIKASGDRLTGVIAQELQEVFPDMVYGGENGTLMVKQFSSWKIIKAIQELASKQASIATNTFAFSAENITNAGTTFEEYINRAVKDVLNSGEIISPLASFSHIRTDIISPLASDHIEVKGVVAIEGSASVAGLLSSENLQTSGDATIGGSATVSGTLYANNIKANSIEGLEDKVKTLISSQTDYSTISGQTISNYHEQLVNVSNPDFQVENLEFEVKDNLDVKNLSSDFGTFRQGLIALGPATFTTASVMDNLSIGTMNITSNSINTFGQDLEIQPLKQGAISLLAGAVRIEVDGTLKISGNAEIAGNLKIRGDITASGSATFNKLNLSLAKPAYAISDTESEASGSAGTAEIRSNRTEVTIYNPAVTEDSLVYITPVGNTSNQSIYLLRQTAEIKNIESTEGSFTVGINNPIDQALKFNWIIVN